VKLYRQRLAHLDQDVSEQLISNAEYEVLYTELSRRLLHDVSRLQQTPHLRKSRRFLWLFILPAPILAVLIYGSLGAYADWKITEQLHALANISSEQEYKAALNGLHDQMTARLQQRPNNIEYRALLARYAMMKEDFQQAAVHYGVLVELLPEDADMWGYYAQSEYLRSGRKVTPVVRHAIDKALAINPMQKTVLGLQGMAAFEVKDYRLAITSWEKLLLTLGDDKATTELIRQGIANARGRLGDDAIDAVLMQGIDVRVELGGNLPEMDTTLSVFVYAKAASGPPMPLAVRRMQLRDLPAIIHLDDSMAMMPQMRLSQFDQVVVGARISFSGQPIAASGDWQGESAAINWRTNNKPVIIIENKVP
jgi:cytochrome c-type biogenesis protein CcmH